jgi:hypothetical protein
MFDESDMWSISSTATLMMTPPALLAKSWASLIVSPLSLFRTSE